jgi:hypothetical protein
MILSKAAEARRPKKTNQRSSIRPKLDYPSSSSSTAANSAVDYASSAATQVSREVKRKARYEVFRMQQILHTKRTYRERVESVSRLYGRVDSSFSLQ